MVQLPVLLRVTVAVEIPDVGSIDEAPAEQDPVEVKFTNWWFAEPLESAVAVTLTDEFEIDTELGSEPRTMV